MTKKIVLTIIIAILFAGAITGAYFGYEKLSEKYSPSTTAPVGEKEEYKNFSMEDADGNTLVTGSIYNYLQQHLKSIDVTKQEAYLPISIVFTPVGVTIKVPSWYVEDVTPDWQ